MGEVERAKEWGARSCMIVITRRENFKKELGREIEVKKTTCLIDIFFEEAK